MAINLPPPTITNTSVNGNRAQNHSRQEASQRAAELPKPPRASENYIPSPASMQTLIGNATLSMNQGVYWDRGSILNLVV